jgi:hypothetical protein
MTSKCALCGGDWDDEETGNDNATYTHEHNGCPLARVEIGLLESEIDDGINAAIEAAKVDKPRPLSRMLIAPCKKLLEVTQLEPYASLYERPIDEIRYWMAEIEKRRNEE